MNLISDRALPPLMVRHRLPAAREKVFEYWTDPDQIRLWLGGPEVEVPHARVDLRETGEYEYTLISSDGNRSMIKGIFLTVEVPEKLVYSWIVENAAGRSPTTRVTVEFIEFGEETEIVVMHEGFLEEPSLDLHHEGWKACFSNLSDMLGQPQS